MVELLHDATIKALCNHKTPLSNQCLEGVLFFRRCKVTTHLPQNIPMHFAWQYSMYRNVDGVFVAQIANGGIYLLW